MPLHYTLGDGVKPIINPLNPGPVICSHGRQFTHEGRLVLGRWGNLFIFPTDKKIQWKTHKRGLERLRHLNG